MKLWTFVASNPKKGQKNNFLTKILSIISDSGDKSGVIKRFFHDRKSASFKRLSYALKQFIINSKQALTA